ncbi:MAG: GNAT family N-acetyltransferase [Gemmataceae bacterium]
MPPSLPLTIGPAALDEQLAALRLLFRSVAELDRETRVWDAYRLLRRGDLHSEGLIVARRDGQLCGVVLCAPVAGACALLWPPQTRTSGDGSALEDALLRRASAWLRQRDVKLVQALLSPSENAGAASLPRNGFARLTQLCYLRHFLDLSAAQLGAMERLHYQTYADDPDIFGATVMRTYEQSSDFPEITGVRQLKDILAGHMAQGNYRPDHWWLAHYRHRPVGVLILTEMPEWRSWDVSYVGVVPEARGRGVGRELMLKALLEAKTVAAPQLTLAVDARNQPARQLYRRLGFEEYDQRDVYLAIWNRAND